MLWIGKLSYSLYLWHWVVLALMRYVWQESELPLSWVVIAVVLTFTLSVLTYYLVENPVRKLNFSVKKSALLFYILPSVIVSGIVFGIGNKKDYYVSNAGLPGQNLPCYQNLDGVCWAGDLSKDSEEILFIGDSHNLHLMPFINKVGELEGWKARVSVANGCPYVFDYIFNDAGNPKNTEFCSKRNPHFDKEYQKYSTIVISNFWSNKLYVQDKLFYTKLELMLQKFIREGKKVYIINSNDYLVINGVRHHFLLEKDMNFIVKDKIFNEEAIKNTHKIEKMVAKYSEIKWIDLSGYFPSIMKGKDAYKIFIDDNHLSEYGAIRLAEEFIKDNKLIRN